MYTIEIKQEDFGGEISSITDCPVARALKRLGHKHVKVGGYTVDFDNIKSAKIVGDCYMEKAKAKKPFTFQLNINLKEK